MIKERILELDCRFTISLVNNDVRRDRHGSLGRLSPSFPFLGVGFARLLFLIPPALEDNQ